MSYPNGYPARLIYGGPPEAPITTAEMFAAQFARLLLEEDMTEPRQTDKAQTPGDDSPDEGPVTDTVPTEDAELESGDEGERKQDD